LGWKVQLLSKRHGSHEALHVGGFVVRIRRNHRTVKTLTPDIPEIWYVIGLLEKRVRKLEEKLEKMESEDNKT